MRVLSRRPYGSGDAFEWWEVEVGPRDDGWHAERWCLANGAAWAVAVASGCDGRLVRSVLILVRPDGE